MNRTWQEMTTKTAVCLSAYLHSIKSHGVKPLESLCMGRKLMSTSKCYQFLNGFDSSSGSKLDLNT